MTKKKSYLALFSILGLSLILLSQCTGSGNQQVTGDGEDNAAGTQKTNERSPGSTGQSLTIAVSMAADEFASLQKLSDKYMETHTDITVQMNNLPAKEAYARLKKASQLGEAPDLMLLDNAWISEFAALGFLQPVDEYYTGEKSSQRIEKVMNQVKWNGYMWGVPKDVDPYILVWNKKAAEELKTDSGPATAEEMLNWNKRWMKPELGTYGIYVDPTDPNAMLALLSALGGTMGEAAMPTMKAGEAASVKTMESFFEPQDAAWDAKQYALNYPALQAAPQAANGPMWQPWDLLATGKMAAMVTTISDYGRHKNAGVAIASLPQGGGPLKGVWLGGRSYTIAARSTDAKAAIEWIKEVTSPDAELRLWTETKKLPTQLSVYNMPLMRGDEHFHSYDWLISNGKSLPFDTENAKKLSTLQSELERLHKGETDVKTFGERAAKLWTAAADKNTATPTPGGSSEPSGSASPTPTPSAGGTPSKLPGVGASASSSAKPSVK
ncbi:MAG: extracellular solute-binding protein [Paenibacillaceae bacterium]|nr:extracellular solute-binding protein [Paenibacillaceae bacterium]